MSEDIKDKKAIELVNKVYSSVAYYLPDLTTMEDEKKFEEIIDYIFDNLGTIDVEKFTEREYAHFAARVAKKFNLTLGAEAYKYVLQESSAKRGIDELLSDEEYENLDYLLMAYDFIVELVPGLLNASDADIEEAFYIINEWLNLEDPKTITNLELAEVAYIISNKLNLEAHPRLLDYLEANKSVRN